MLNRVGGKHPALAVRKPGQELEFGFRFQRGKAPSADRCALANHGFFELCSRIVNRVAALPNYNAVLKV